MAKKKSGRSGSRKALGELPPENKRSGKLAVAKTVGLFALVGFAFFEYGRNSARDEADRRSSDPWRYLTL